MMLCLDLPTGTEGIVSDVFCLFVEVLGVLDRILFVFQNCVFEVFVPKGSRMRIGPNESNGYSEAFPNGPVATNLSKRAETQKSAGLGHPSRVRLLRNGTVLNFRGACRC